VHHMYRSPFNLTVKTALKFVDFSRRYRQNNLGVESPAENEF